MKPLHILFLLVINLFWGFNIVPVKLSLDITPPLTASLIRMSFVALLCAPALRWWPGQMGNVFGYAITGGALMFSFINAGIALASNVSAISIAGQLGVPFSLILAIIFLGERIGVYRIIGIVLAFAGVALLSFDPHVFDEREALLLSAISSLCYAIGSLFVRRMHGVGALSLQGWMALISLPILVVLSMVFEPGALQQMPNLPWQAYGYQLASAIMASLIGHAGYTWLLQRYSVATIAPMTMLSPVIAVGCGVLIFGNVLTLELIGGGLITLLGVGIITLRNAQKREDA